MRSRGSVLGGGAVSNMSWRIESCAVKSPRRCASNSAEREILCAAAPSVLPESGAFREPEGYRDAGMTMVASDFCGFGIT